MKIAVTGGKGGTGKSTISTALALELSKENRLLLVDADVECPDDHIILSTTREKVKDVHALLPRFNQEKCIKCGCCADVCKENAVVMVKDKYPFIVTRQCNGCGACLLVCSSGALSEGRKVIGAIYQGESQLPTRTNKERDKYNLLLIWGEMDVGCETTSLVVNATREYADALASDYDCILIDTAAGTHCNVISAMIGVDLALAVTEPTPLGKHDLELILQLLKIMELPTQIIVNKYDVGNLDLIENASKNNDVSIIQKIPYERDILKKHSRGQPVVHKNIEELANTLVSKLNHEGQEGGLQK
ncbi:MAG: P-loop NTPase [Methanobacteriaceae archaeon]|nr:P-loop NTPase [Methanobacteriaceae archaeon]